MNLKELWEKTGVTAVTIVVAWSGTQLSRLNDTAIKLAEEIAAMKREQTFASYRLDQQRDLLKSVESRVSGNDVKLGRIELKIFDGRR